MASVNINGDLKADVVLPTDAHPGDVLIGADFADPAALSIVP